MTRNIVNALVNTTTSTQEPIFAQDIDLAVQTISTLNKYSMKIFNQMVGINVFCVFKCYRSNCC